MAIVTSQQIQQYYTHFKDIEITMTKEVGATLGIINSEVFLKTGGFQWPCVLYSTSFSGAKVVLSLKPDQLEDIRSSASLSSLHYGFRVPDKTDPIAFYVSAKVKGLTKYVSKNPDLYFASLEYNKRPPDDMLEIIGRFLETNINAKKRKEERIPWNNDLALKMGLSPTGTSISVDGILRKCLVRDISFGGCKVLIPGVAKFLAGKPSIIKFSYKDGTSNFLIPGRILRADPVEGRKDIAVAAVQFDESNTPMDFKMKLNDVFRSSRK
jgi:hypothetical protein